MRVLAGSCRRAAGRVRVAGLDAAVDPAGVRAAVGYCPDVGGLIPRATPWEHLQLAARLRGMRPGWEDRAPATCSRASTSTAPPTASRRASRTA